MITSRRNLLAGLVVGAGAATLPVDATPAQTAKHLPLCKDCKYFQMPAGDPERVRYRSLAALCSHKIPDFLLGGSPFEDQRIWLAQEMRLTGPCGMEAYLFEVANEAGA